MKKELLIRVLQVAISIGLLTYFLSTINLWEAVRAATQVPVASIVLVLALFTCCRLLMPVKWQLLLASNTTLSLWTGIRLYYKASFIGQFLPSTIGTDGARIVFLRGQGISAVESFSTILLERGIGFGVLALFAGIGAVILFDAYALLFCALMLVSSGFVVLFAGRRVLSVYAIEKIARALRFAFSIRTSNLMFFALLTVLELLLLFMAVFVLVQGMGLSVEKGYLFSFLPIHFLLSRLPVSFSGWGVREAGYVYFLGAAGVSASSAVTIGLLQSILLFVGLLPGAIFLLLEAVAGKESAVVSCTLQNLGDPSGDA